MQSKETILAPHSQCPPDKTRAWAEIDLAAIAHNYHVVRQRVGRTRQVMCAVKANAYGHGAVAVSRALAAAGADMLAVATVAEGVELRDAGIQTPILMLGTALPEEAEAIVEHGLRPIVCTATVADALNSTSARHGKQTPVHIKVDTGMGRIGVPSEHAVPFVARVAGLAHLTIEGICTHFASAGDEDKTFTLEQVERFTQVVQTLADDGIDIPLKHAANSAAIIDMPQSHFTAVRPGLMLYGCYGSRFESRSAGIQQALTLKARVTFLKDVPSGTSIGYGRTHFTSRPSRIATLSIGYADGYDRRLSNRGHALVQGCRAPVVGRVCMDQCLIDVTDVPDASIGDEVVLYGQQGAERISVDDVADEIGTVPHVVLCAVGPRIPRFYVP